MMRIRSRRGLASALIIMLLVLLVFFGVLSLVTTAADFRLARKRAEWNAAYYKADSAAVNVLAGLDRLIAGLEPAALQADQMAEQLGHYLDSTAGVLSWQIKKSADRTEEILVLEALVVSDPPGGQGISMRLVIKTGEWPSETQRISIESWSQWQKEFDYDGSEGGIWKG